LCPVVFYSCIQNCFQEYKTYSLEALWFMLDGNLKN
jgi:hypothetical protein